MNGWTEQARSLIGQALLAPSSHSTQPCFFRISDAAIELYADRMRALPVNDPEDRKLTISCGCALMNLRVAAAGGGVRGHVQLFPEPEEPDLLARFSLSARSSVSTEESQLAEFMERRRTYRRKFAAREVSAAVIDRLIGAAKREGAHLQPVLTEKSSQHAALLIAVGDAALWANPSWRRELAAWMHPRRRRDGLTVPSFAVPMAQLIVRTFDMGGGVGAKDRDLAEASPLLAILATDRDAPREWLLAGQALQYMLLVACQNGLQASYLNQPIQVARLRPRLQSIVGGGFPQILLRLGYPAEEIPAAARREVDDVIDRGVTPCQGDAIRTC